MFSRVSWTTLHKVFTSTMFGPWLTDNFCEEYNLCNVVMAMLGNIALLSNQGYLRQNVVEDKIRLRQHCKEKLLGQSWPRAHVFARK